MYLRMCVCVCMHAHVCYMEFIHVTQINDSYPAYSEAALQEENRSDAAPFAGPAFASADPSGSCTLIGKVSSAVCAAI